VRFAIWQPVTKPTLVSRGRPTIADDEAEITRPGGRDGTALGGARQGIDHGARFFSCRGEGAAQRGAQLVAARQGAHGPLAGQGEESARVARCSLQDVVGWAHGFPCLSRRNHIGSAGCRDPRRLV
jgi:hypothetical protein